MSWDIVIFNSKQQITSVEKIEEELLVPIDFNAIIEKHFSNMIIDNDHREIKGESYTIDYFAHSEPVSNILFSLYG